MLTMYHSTDARAVAKILKSGFRDPRMKHMTLGVCGVWLSNAPLDTGQGAKGNVLLKVMLNATDVELANFELIEEDRPFREWCIPAAFVNERATVQVADIDEI